MRARLLRALALAASIAAGAGAAAAPDSSEPALIRIDAVVSDGRGRAIENLTAEDFEIAEDGNVRPVESVRFVRGGGGADDPGPALIRSRADEQAAAAQEGARVFAVLLDEFHVTPGPGTDRARLALTRLVGESLGPRDLVLVVKPLDSLLNLRLTRDRQPVLQRIASFEGRKGRYEPRNAFEQELIAGSPQRIEAVRNQISTSALNALATHLAALGAAHKTIVFVSEGFEGRPRRRGDEALPSIDTVIRSASRGGVTIHPFDPGDPPAAESPARGMLRALAERTDGRAIVDRADPAADLTRLATESSAYYLVAFRSGNLEADGRFHAVTVRVRRPDTNVSARKGYWAPSADDVLRAKLLARGPEPRRPPEPPRRISPLIRPWFGVARGDRGATRVSFVWEPAARVPGAATIRPPAPARIRLTATRPDGTPVFEGAVRPAGVGASESAGVEPVRAVFESTPGRLRLQMLIEDAASRVVDTDVRDLIVNPLSAIVTFGSAEIIRARSAREHRALAADLGAVPTPAREFSRSERLLIRVPLYSPDAPAVTAWLVSRPGAVMRTLSVSEGPGPNLHQIDLPLAGLASGAYLVRFAATGPAGAAQDEIAFRVTP